MAVIQMTPLSSNCMDFKTVFDILCFGFVLLCFIAAGVMASEPKNLVQF